MVNFFFKVLKGKFALIQVTLFTFNSFVWLSLNKILMLTILKSDKLQLRILYKSDLRMSTTEKRMGIVKKRQYLPHH